MSKIFDIYYASNSIDVLTQIIRSIKTKQSNVNQSNTTAIASNLFLSNAKFNLFNKKHAKFYFVKTIQRNQFKNIY